MEEKAKVEDLIAKIREYGEERIRLIILTVHEKSSKILSTIISKAIMMVVAVFALFFLSFAGAWWIGKEMQEPFLGFLMIGGIYLLIGIIVFINLDRWFRTPFINLFLKNMSEDEN